MDEAKTDEQLGPLLEYFTERLNRVFAHYFFAYEFVEDSDLHGDAATNDRAWSLQTMRNACLHETLLAIRDLDEFLSDKKPRTDDLRAVHFGYAGNHSFLADAERANINKLIAHTTSYGAARPTFRWDIWELTTKAIAQSHTFLRWVEEHYGLGHFVLWTAAVGARTKTERMLAFVRKHFAQAAPDE